MAVELPRRRSLYRRLLPLLVAIVLFGALAVSQLRNSGEGIGDQKPVLTVAFPSTAEAGSVQTATLTIENPAASDIESLFVSFSALAVGGGADLPTPIVSGAQGAESPIVSIEPRPLAQAEGVRFGFGPLESGATKVIRFDLRMPEITGAAANSIAVYDGTLPERSSGDSIEVTLES